MRNTIQLCLRSDCQEVGVLCLETTAMEREFSLVIDCYRRRALSCGRWLWNESSVLRSIFVDWELHPVEDPYDVVWGASPSLFLGSPIKLYGCVPTISCRPGGPRARFTPEGGPVHCEWVGLPQPGRCRPTTGSTCGGPQRNHLPTACAWLGSRPQPKCVAIGTLPCVP